MAERPLSEQHKPYLARLQHLGEHYATERTRLEAELHYVLQQAQRFDTEMVNFLRNSYGIDARQTAVQVDTDRGVIVTPEVAPAAAEAPEAPLEEDEPTPE